jgi:hypothetical protein
MSRFSQHFQQYFVKFATPPNPLPPPLFPIPPGPPLRSEWKDRQDF